jgi:putative toxin-antitoxin system antitoxin component (TIGR02293 family)
MAAEKHKVPEKTETNPGDSMNQALGEQKKYADYTTNEAMLYASDFKVEYERNPRYMDDISLLKRSKEGLSARSALDFLELSGFSQDEFQQVFNTTVKTIQNHAAKALTLDATLSEKLLKSFALFDKGVEVFGSAKYFNQWLHKPAYGLGYQVPLDMMDTITGIRLVEDQLIRIEFGAFA